MNVWDSMVWYYWVGVSPCIRNSAARLLPWYIRVHTRTHTCRICKSWKIYLILSLHTGHIRSCSSHSHWYTYKVDLMFQITSPTPIKATAIHLQSRPHVPDFQPYTHKSRPHCENVRQSVVSTNWNLQHWCSRKHDMLTPKSYDKTMSKSKSHCENVQS